MTKAYCTFVNSTIITFYIRTWSFICGTDTKPELTVKERLYQRLENWFQQAVNLSNVVPAELKCDSQYWNISKSVRNIGIPLFSKYTQFGRAYRAVNP